MAVDVTVMPQVRKLAESPLSVHKVSNLAQKLLSDLGCSSDCELSILFATDEYIRELNKQYRHKDYATDVLSFAACEAQEIVTPVVSLGDVVISLETALEQAKSLEVSFEEEVLRLLIHGLLHLLGYDHEGVAEEEVLRMQKKEDLLFDKFVDEFSGVKN